MDVGDGEVLPLGVGRESWRGGRGGVVINGEGREGGRERGEGGKGREGRKGGRERGEGGRGEGNTSVDADPVSQSLPLHHPLPHHQHGDGRRGRDCHQHARELPLNVAGEHLREKKSA